MHEKSKRRIIALFSRTSGTHVTGAVHACGPVGLHESSADFAHQNPRLLQGRHQPVHEGEFREH